MSDNDDGRAVDGIEASEHVKPAARAVSWDLLKYGTMADGERVIVLRMYTEIGPLHFFMPASAAQLLARQLIETAQGLAVVREMPT